MVDWNPVYWVNFIEDASCEFSTSTLGAILIIKTI
jgi:hypothetical protein